MNFKKIYAEFVYLPLAVPVLLLYPFLLVAGIALKIWTLLTRAKKSLVGETALITGSARGLGRETAIALAKNGCNVIIADILEEKAEETAEFIRTSFNVKTKAYKVDISSHQELCDLKQKINKDMGDVSIVINNAGKLVINKNSLIEIQQMINVNFTAVAWINQLFLPDMMRLNRGHIVTISSEAAVYPMSYHHGFHIYSATKAAIRNLMTAMRREIMISKRSINVTAVLPTFLRTSEEVIDVTKNLGLNRLTPFIDSSVVVDEIVGALQYGGKNEIFVPYTSYMMAALLDFLPVAIADFCLVTLFQMFVKGAKPLHK